MYSNGKIENMSKSGHVAYENAQNFMEITNMTLDSENIASIRSWFSP